MIRKNEVRTALTAIAALVLSGCAASTHMPAAPLAQGARYVAMGSSYAAGSGAGAIVPESPRRCGRTQNNYAHLLARSMGLDLVDVSCGGATTAHILGPWSELPPQIDAVTPDTRLVTVTVGGNDVNYVRNLMIAMCGRAPGMFPAAGHACPSTAWPAEADFQLLDRQLRRIAQEVRRRAPKAQLVFVDYVQILPDAGACADVPLEETEMAAARETFRRLAVVTKKVASAEGAMMLPAGEMSRSHNACSNEPWSSGFRANPVAWHPTPTGHAAIAEALAARLR